MTVNYTITELDSRLGGVVSTIDANGNGYIILRQNHRALSTMQLARPSGLAVNGVLTFQGQILDPSAAGTGFADNAVIEDAIGNIVVSGLTVGNQLSNADILLTNGINSTLISSGQTIALLSAQIVGA